MTGSISASPAATLRTATTSCWAAASFSKNPLTPAPERLVNVLVGVERGQDQHLGGRPEGDDLAGSAQPVQDGHPDVEQRDHGGVLADERDRLRAITGLRQHVEVRLGFEDQPQPLPDQPLVVGDHDGDWQRHRAAPSSAGREVASP
jgi:hypothetical protein